MKAVKKALGGVTINDIVSTAVGRAVWRYMAFSYERSKGTGAFKSLPSPEKWLMSDFEGVSMWMTVPDKFGNKFGAARTWIALPDFLSKTARNRSPSESILREVKAKRMSTNFNIRKLMLPVAFHLSTRLIPNTFPVFIANQLLRVPTNISYFFSNVRGMPVQMLCLGCPLSKVLLFPQLFASTGKSWLMYKSLRVESIESHVYDRHLLSFR